MKGPNGVSKYPKETGRMLDRTIDGKALSFAVDSPQKWHDCWRGVDRVMRFYGACAACGRRTYAFDDGENDPRGVLGDHAADTIELAEHLSEAEAMEVDAVGGVTLPACFMCTNDYDAYTYLLDRARRLARKKGADV